MRISLMVCEDNITWALNVLIMIYGIVMHRR